LPAAGDHVRALPQQFSGQGRGQFQRGAQGQARPLQLRALSRALAGQGRQLVAGQGDFFVQGVQLAMGFRQRRLGLADFEMGAETTVQAPLRQFENLLLLLQGGGHDIALGEVQGQLDVAAHHVVHQFQLGLTRFGHAHVGQVDGALGVVAFAAPEVQGITEAQGGVVVPGGGVGQGAGAVELIGGPVVALEGGVALDLQRLGRLGDTGQGLGLAHPGGGHGQARAALHGEADPAVQLRVAVGLPPLGTGPVGILRGALDRLVGGQCISGKCLALWGNASGSDAAADC